MKEVTLMFGVFLPLLYCVIIFVHVKKKSPKSTPKGVTLYHRKHSCVVCQASTTVTCVTHAP